MFDTAGSVEFIVDYAARHGSAADADEVRDVWDKARRRSRIAEELALGRDKVMGFVKAGSKASLIAGGLSGVLLLVAGWLVRDKVYVGLGLGLVISLALAGRFAPTFLETKKFMPAGLMLVITIIALALRNIFH